MGTYGRESHLFKTRSPGSRRSGISKAKRLRIYVRDNFTCQGCGLKFPENDTGIAPEMKVGYVYTNEWVGTYLDGDYRDVPHPNIMSLEIHHCKVPYSKNGSNHDDNLQALCNKCNGKLGNRFYVEG